MCMQIKKLDIYFLTLSVIKAVKWFALLFQLAGGTVLAVGVWTLVEKSDYISLLNSNLYSASAYTLIAAGVVVIVSGMIGCCATLKEMRSLLIVVR